MRLITPRLVLRPARRDDAEDLHALFSSPLYMRYGSTAPHKTMAETQGWVDRMVGMPPEQGCDFIVEHQGRAVGKCGVWRWPEIGYGIHRTFGVRD